MKTKPKYLRVKCPQCEALAINGTACHEHGCPNSRRPWVQEGDMLVPGEGERCKCKECGQVYYDRQEAYDCCNPDSDFNRQLALEEEFA